ncbi:hypothetical protein XSR1_10059 [Xenorhabdus szentirmaii DSM 16338]|uniref:Uncharacterized protein n=1 Tax=Xenorhabdus szentirmaii DSM 16338 TaxID=1427518 RepID=W1IQ74_9GAMM|nr:hypothetical protein XSR1_10059 [Xenorhabdus szentirmaii DSM 16338]
MFPMGVMYQQARILALIVDISTLIRVKHLYRLAQISKGSLIL